MLSKTITGVSLESHAGFVYDPNGLLLMFEPPQRNAIYYLGADIGSGTSLEGDGDALSNSVIQVVRAGDLVRPNEQVAELACSKLSASEFSAMIDHVGRLYWVDEWDLPALACVESNNYGHETLTALEKDYEYPNIFHMLHWDRVGNIQATRIGFETNTRTRPAMILHGESAIKKRQLLVNSPWTFGEMAEFNLTKLKNTSALQQDLLALAGKFAGKDKDDRLMALFIAEFCLYLERQDIAADRQRQQEKIEEAEEKEKREPGGLTDYQNSLITYDQMMAEYDEL